MLLPFWVLARVLLSPSVKKPLVDGRNTVPLVGSRAPMATGACLVLRPWPVRELHRKLGLFENCTEGNLQFN